jgi:hypothetical protein
MHACRKDTTHYWDHDLGDHAGLWDLPSAYDRALDTWQEALVAYGEGDYDKAYCNLGRTAHLVQDMAIPAHALCDPHGLPLLVDDFEQYANTPGNLVHSTGGTGGGLNDNLRHIMLWVADKADDYDSNRADGETEIVDRANGFQLGELQGISAACVPRAEEGTARLFWLFYDKVKPQVSLCLPIEGSMQNGNGFSLSADAQAYLDSSDNKEFIQKVRFSYATKDSNLQPADWSTIADVTELDTNKRYNHS